MVVLAEKSLLDEIQYEFGCVKCISDVHLSIDPNTAKHNRPMEPNGNKYLLKANKLYVRSDKQPEKRRAMEGKKRQVIVHSLNFRSAQTNDETRAEPERSP